MEFKISSGCYNISLTTPACCTCHDDPTETAVKLNPAHPENPFDEMGLAHNEALEALSARLPVGGFQDRDLLKHVVAFVKNYPWSNAEIQAQVGKGGPDVIDCFGGWSFHMGLYPYQVDLPSDHEKALMALFDRLKAAGIGIGDIGTRLIAYGSHQLDAQGLIDFFKGLEKQVLASKVNLDDRNSLLAMGAVARYSTVFWAMVKKQGTAPVNSDVAGAAAGAAAGIITGVGVFVGALVGGIGRSLGYLVGKG